MQRASTLPKSNRPAASSPAQKYGPPAVAPTPATTAEFATPNCTAMNAPDEMPDTEISFKATL